MWPVEYDQCMLSIKEKLLIEKYLRERKVDRALDILRETWKFVITYEPKHRNVAETLQNIKILVNWIKEGDYKGKIPLPSEEENNKESLFWDWICDFILGEWYVNNLFECDSEEQADKFFSEFKKHVPMHNFGMIRRNDTTLNLFEIKTQSSS